MGQKVDTEKFFYTLDESAVAVSADAPLVSAAKNTSVSGRKHLLIVLKQGKEDGGRQALVAFSTGLSSQLSGVETSVFLVSSGVIWARQGQIEKISIRGFEPLQVYFKSFLAKNGNVLVSLPCMSFFNDLDSVLERKRIIAGIQYAGLAKLADMVNSSTVLSL